MNRKAGLKQPIRKLGAQTLSKTVRSRVKETLEDERLKDWLGEETTENNDPGKDGSGDNADNNDDEWGGIED